MELSDLGRPYPPPPAELRAIYDVLGRADTIRFLMTFGGARLYVAERPRPSSPVVELVGRERALKLGAIRDKLPTRIPLGKRWIAGVMHAEGASVGVIARTLLTTDVTVRSWLKGRRYKPGGRR